MIKNFNMGKGNNKGFGKNDDNRPQQPPTFDSDTELDETNRPAAPTFGEGDDDTERPEPPTFGEGDDDSERPEPPTFGGRFDRNFWGSNENDLSNDELIADNNFAKPNDMGEILGTEKRFEISLGFGENNFGGDFGGFGGMSQPTFGGRQFSQNQPQQSQQQK